MCRKILEAKDKTCRKQGYKRDWITTNVDIVADSIKNHAEKLRGLPVFTRDFTRTYTSIPQENLANKVISAMHEAFTWKALDTKTLFANLRADVTYDFNGHAEAEFKAEGLAKRTPEVNMYGSLLPARQRLPYIVLSTGWTSQSIPGVFPP